MTALRVENLTLDISGRRLLDNLSFELLAGTSMAIMGPSGSGKTSLINCLSGVVRPTAGRIWLNGSEITFLGTSARAAERLKNVGYVFQFGELLPELNVIENVALPLKLRGVAWSEAEARARRQLESVGLAERANERTEVLSGGEVQRVAIARAIVGQPAVILADEPTGALDDDNAGHVTKLIFSLSTQLSAGVVVGTHNQAVASQADKAFVLKSGKLEPIKLRRDAGW